MAPAPCWTSQNTPSSSLVFRTGAMPVRTGGPSRKNASSRSCVSSSARNLVRTFQGLRHPPMFDEERHDANAPGVEVRLFPTWFLVDEPPSAGDDGGPGTSPRGRKAPADRRVRGPHCHQRRQAFLQGRRKESGREPDPLRRRLRQGPSSGHRLAFPRPSQRRPLLPQAALLGSNAASVPTLRTSRFAAPAAPR